MATLTCSLNVTIPSDMIIIWSHNGSVVRTDGVSRAGKSTTLVIENFEPSDAGHYECVFNNAINNGWTLRRNIRLLITSMFLYHKIIYNILRGRIKGHCREIYLILPCNQGNI